MLKLKKIAITGGVASGKSSVCQFFKELGAYVVNADAIAHELLKPDTNLGQQVIRIFGPEILNHGQISRGVLAKKVFQDSDQLNQLEKLLHPAVLQRMAELYETASSQNGYSLFVAEVPLLFEIGVETFYDVIITVLSDEAEAKKRFKHSEYDLRMKRQLKPKEKAARSHYIIHNNGSLEALRQEVIQLNRIIKQ